MSIATHGSATESDAQLDPVTYEVIRHRLASINEEACTTMVHVSGSPVVHASDFNFAIYTPEGDMATVGLLYMIPVGTMSVLVKLIMERFGDTVAEGDIFFCNDPYLAAAHQNDVQVVSPLFIDGILVAWTGGCAHELDVGGMQPGSWCPNATDVFQEGLRVPPVRLRRKGEKQEDLYNIILGASRLPGSLEMDLTAMIAANEVAQGRIRELHERYGTPTVLSAMARTLDHSETAVRAALRKLPDGVFTHTDFLDHDGLSNEIYHVTCVLTKTGDELLVDLTHSSPQAAGFVNSTRPSTEGAIISGVFPLLGAQAPTWNSGVMRPIAIKTEPGTIVHPLPPAPVSASSTAGAWTASHTVVAALSKLISLGDDSRENATATSDGCWPLLNLFGLDPNGEPFGDMFLDPLAWGGGAYNHRDGIDAGGAFIGPTGHILDVETKENAVPVMYLWRRQRPNTGGPGAYRGGVTTEFAVTPHRVPAIQATLATHGVAAPNCAGMFGGFPGAGATFECVKDTVLIDQMRDEIPDQIASINGEIVEFGAKPPPFYLQAGDVVNIIPQGGGGYGDPLDRTVSAVQSDVDNRLLSRDEARTIYGAVFFGDTIDEKATQENRAAALVQRLAVAEPAKGQTVTVPADAVKSELGGALGVRTTAEGRRYIVCEACSTGLGDASTDWQSSLRSLALTTDMLPGETNLDERMAVTARLCPGCGRSHSVVVHRVGEEFVTDLIIN